MVTTLVPAVPFIMKNAIVAFGDPATADEDFAAAVSSAVLTPSSGITPYKGLKPTAVFTFPQAVTYTLDLTFAQDWASAESLSRYLFEHVGETVPATLNVDDKATGSTSWALDVAIVPGSVGGPVDSVAESTVSLGVVGQPVPTYTPVTPLAVEPDVEAE